MIENGIFFQGPPDYYADNFYGDDDFDDYERELRDYGHRQRERERERETGRRPEESSRSRDRGEVYREKSRDRKRAYTPLSEDEQPRVFDNRSDDDDDDDYSEKGISSKIVMPSSGDKKTSVSQEQLHEVILVRLATLHQWVGRRE